MSKQALVEFVFKIFDFALKDEISGAEAMFAVSLVWNFQSDQSHLYHALRIFEEMGINNKMVTKAEWSRQIVNFPILLQPFYDIQEMLRRKIIGK
jgi:hypothetical protein